MKNIDQRLSEGFYNAGGAFRPFWFFVARFGLYFYLLVYLALVLILQDASQLIGMFFAVFIPSVIALCLQYFVKRPRPRTEATFDLWVHTYSFPSTHTAASFAASATLSHLFIISNVAAVSWYVLLFAIVAGFIAASRLFTGVHYVSDVLAGFILGSLISILMLIL
ncbi:MAG: phosphatase PAP2 family protein [bacterium]|nr:phosphatase PAP2 family protein [bacterium]